MGLLRNAKDATAQGQYPQTMQDGQGYEYWRGPAQLGLADPYLQMEVMDKELPFLVDTGVLFSDITGTMSQSKISLSSVQLIGFSGRSESLPLTMPLTTKVAGQTFLHQCISSPTCPVNLMGRDLLLKCGASILCGSDGLMVIFPNGYALNCSMPTLQFNSQMLLSADVSPISRDLWADVLGALTT